jgi:hypothetical protein
MRNLNELDNYRIKNHPAGLGDEGNGAFKLFINGRSFFVLATDGGGWEHVSVSLRNQKRCPTWEEMCAVKDLFFHPDEVVMQLHPAKSDYINNHPYCLHLWRPIGKEIPLPPVDYV